MPLCADLTVICDFCHQVVPTSNAATWAEKTGFPYARRKAAFATEQIVVACWGCDGRKPLEARMRELGLEDEHAMEDAQNTGTVAEPEVDAATAEKVEQLAKILHESGREAVEKRMIYRSDLPVKPFAEWDELDENTKEGRRMMARFVRSRPDVAELLS